MFVSKAYREKDWTNHERKSVLAAALRARREYVLPVRFDDTELDGLPPTKKWLDARKLTPIALAQSVFKKLVALGITMAKSEVPPRSPGAIAWRIARRHFGTDLIGSANAAGRFGGRWNPRGIPVLYAGASFCTALLEVLARLPAATNVTDYIAMPIRIQASVAIETLYESSLPPGWRSLSLRQSDVLRQIGANWLQSRRTCVLSVPSAAVRNERLFLLNPTHPVFSSLEVLTPEPLDLDPRLFRAT